MMFGINIKTRLGLLALTVLLMVPVVHAQEQQFAVASAHPLATQAGLDILNAGGNAFDAAVAVSAALAVVEPAGSGLGGGGFWLLHDAATGKQIMVDGRETAPLAATADMYDKAAERGIVRPSINGPLAAGIPGEPAALAHIAEKYGDLPLAALLQPAIGYAQNGFVVDKKILGLLKFRQQALANNTAAAAIFLPQGQLPSLGDKIIQTDLAATLRAMAHRGHAGFYAGDVADKLITSVQAAGGIWTQEDLQNYSVVERAPIVGQYRQFKIVSAAPPSSGGVTLVTALQILAGYPEEYQSQAHWPHLVVEAMRRAYRDRAEYLGDPDFVSMPLPQLLSPHYAAGLRANIHPRKASSSELLAPVAAYDPAGADTTHFSVVDAAGNRVAATLSINLPFGAAFVAAGTGVLLNDEMDDFAAHPGKPNAYGLVHGDANTIAPGKRMLSSMSPTFIEHETGFAVLGTPGGSRIISMVLLAALDYMHGGSADSMVALPRYHHQYLPDVVQYEPDKFTQQWVTQLETHGHTPKPRSRGYGNMQVVIYDNEQGLTAAADPRGVGAATVLFQK